MIFKNLDYHAFHKTTGLDSSCHERKKKGGKNTEECFQTIEEKRDMANAMQGLQGLGLDHGFNQKKKNIPRRDITGTTEDI